MEQTASEKAKAYRVAHPSKAAADSKAWRAKHPTFASHYSRQYYIKNLETEKLRTSSYRKAHIEQYRILERKRNKTKVAKNSARRAKKVSATPTWLTDKDYQSIKSFYENTPRGFEVDHIIPLISNIVCGLHVPWNLQYLTSKANRQKGNKICG